jgi:3-isopropylmalate/(R)-2-methylmalate dehydratase small subunit
MRFIGKVHKFRAHIDTDVIIPARYLMETRPEMLAKKVMEDEDPTFASRVQPGDIIVAGELFGMGSSREHAPIAIKAAGIACVIAPSFARIFLRNAINIGLPVLEVKGVWEAVESGDELEVDLVEGTVRLLRTGAVFRAAPFPDFILGIIRAGGLVNYTKEQLARARAASPPA